MDIRAPPGSFSPLTVMVTPGMGIPSGSVTLPRIRPVVWARAGRLRAKQRAATESTTKTRLLMASPLLEVAQDWGDGLENPPTPSEVLLLLGTKIKSPED
jgi:hypothetical protein